MDQYRLKMKLAAFGLPMLGTIGVAAQAAVHQPTSLISALLPAASAAIAGLLTEMMGNAISEHPKPLADPKELLENEHLTKAVGKAIAALLDASSDEPQNADDRDKLRAMALTTRDRWVDIELRLDETFAEISSFELLDFFKGAPGAFRSKPALTPELWESILKTQHWFDTKRNCYFDGQELQKTTLESVSARLHKDFATALFDALAKDAESDGEAFAKLTLLMLGQLLATSERTQEVSETLLTLTRETLADTTEIAIGVERIQAVLTTLNQSLLSAAARFEKQAERIIEAIDKPTRLRQIGRILPPSIGASFVGKERLLSPLTDVFFDSEGLRFQSASPAILTANGGFGKSRTAIEFAHANSSLYETVLFLNSTSIEQFRESLVRVASPMGLSVVSRSQADIYQEVLASLPAYCHNGLLIIVDGIDEPGTAKYVKGQLQALGSAHIVITSRLKHWGQSFKQIEIGALSIHEATRMLSLSDGSEAKTQHAHLESVATLLGGMPLALETAVAYVRLRGMNYDEYERLLTETPKQLLNWQDSLAADYPTTVWNAFRLTWKQLDMDHPHAWSTLQIGALYASTPIPIEWFPKSVDTDGKLPEVESYDRDNILAILHRYSQVELRSDGTFSIHNVVRQILRAEQTDSGWQLITGTALKHLYKLSLQNSESPSTWMYWETLRPHLEALVEHSLGLKIVHPSAWMLIHLGKYLLQREEFQQAAQIFHRAVFAMNSAWGGEDGAEDWVMFGNPDIEPMYIEGQLGLSTSLRLTGSLEAAYDALTMAFNNMPDRENNPLSSRARRVLAENLLASGRTEEAEQVIRHLLNDQESHQGSFDRDVAETLRLLSDVMLELERHSEAEAVLWRACRIDARWRIDSPLGRVVGTSLLNTELILAHGGSEWEDFQNVLETELTITFTLPTEWKVRYARYTPALADDLVRLANLRNRERDEERAFRLMVRALAIYWYCLGPMHQSTFRAWNAVKSKLAPGSKLRYSSWVLGMVAFEVHSAQAEQ